MKTCEWVNPENKLYVKYHDREWGVPVHNDRKLFEILILEGAQAGLSWETVLKKRENYRKAFDGFDFNKIAKYKAPKKKQLLKNEGIIRNRLKIESAVRNARAFVEIRKEFGTFDKYIWNFIDTTGAQRPIQNKFRSVRELPAKTTLSDKISADLKKRGMSFVGSTIIYAFMQATGMVNDHRTECFRYKEIARLGKGR